MITYQPPYKAGYKVTCPFGRAGSWAAGWHIGNDFVGLTDKHIYPIAEGTVESVNARGKAYGNHVTVLHPDGRESLYAHLASISVKKGQRVTTNTVLGIEGESGNANGKHLHLEVHDGGYHYPPKGSKPATCPWLIDALTLFKGVDIMADVPQWQIDACKIVCQTKGFSDTEGWLRKVETNQLPTWGEIFGVLAKCL